MVPLSSVKMSRVPTYLIRQSVRFVYGAITHYGSTSQSFPLQTICSAGPLSLAATEGISVDFFSSGYLDVSVPLVRFLRPMYSVKGYLAYTRWVSPFRHLWITGWLPPSRSFSQAPTSFIASNCQGIHRMHLVA